MKNPIHKKFLLNQPLKKLDSKTELIVLEQMLRSCEIQEEYRMAALVYRRMESIKKDESQDRS